MKKGKIYTCNGCLAFEESIRTYPTGSPSAATSSNPFCGLGHDIIQKNKIDYKPKCGECQKPKTIDDFVREKTKFYNACHIKN